MRVFRLPSWISESRGSPEVHVVDPIMAGDPKSLVAQVAGVAKRKRDEVDDVANVTPERSHQHKKLKSASSGAGSVLKQVDINQESLEAPINNGGGCPKVSASRLRDAIDTQLSLEILLKHNELRLINQELAKSQTALEQLRRCHLIPFPVSQGTQQPWEDIINGTGPSIMPRNADVKPQWAPPFGVTEGPYTRHYAKWLIPDPSFDGVQQEWERGTRAGKTVGEGRTTRNSFADSTPLGKARTQRGSAGQKLQALPSGYTQSKENAGPSIVKRADGQYVKLVCLDCRRENFGSTQGFINHCRIAHRREFKSHEEAAVQSGHPIELDEVGGIVGEEKHTSAATGLVHPLIRSAPTDKDAYAALLSRIAASLNMYREGKLPGVTAIPGTTSASPKKNTAQKVKSTGKNFKPSTITPYLSDLMKHRGFDGNLGELVDEAKKQAEFEVEDSSLDEDSDGEKSSTPAQRAFDGSSEPILPTMRVPSRSTMSPAPFGRPNSSKGPEGNRNSRKAGTAGNTSRMPYAAPINTAAAVNHHRPTTEIDHDQSTPGEETDNDLIMIDGPSIIDLSPNTIASNNAPSLVSDDGEYEDGDDAESSIDDSVGEDEGSDVAEITFDDGEGEEKMLPQARHTSRTGGDGMKLRKDEKHVTFVSPMKETKKQRRGRR